MKKLEKEFISKRVGVVEMPFKGTYILN